MSVSADNRPLGVFDSGIGGLSIVREMQRLMPSEHLIYASDAAFVPYGDRDEEFICERSLYLAEALIGRDIKALVIACNTATAAAAEMLRARFDLPIIGIEPAVKPATVATSTGIIGILATASTLGSRRYADLLRRFGHFAKVINQPCPGLVDAIESDEMNVENVRSMLQGFIDPLVQQGADTLVLGCTHYPLVIDLIRETAGADVRIVDPGLAVARRVLDLIDPCAEQTGTLTCLTTGDAAVQARQFSRILGCQVAVKVL